MMRCKGEGEDDRTSIFMQIHALIDRIRSRNSFIVIFDHQAEASSGNFYDDFRCTDPNWCRYAVTYDQGDGRKGVGKTLQELHF